MFDYSPVVALSLRFDRIDCFWFTLMHELAHVVKGHKGLRVDNLETSDEVDTEECLANKQAGDWLIPSEQLDNFIRTSPNLGYTAIARFAASIGRHPGIVCGRLQRDKKVGYDHRKFMVKVSPYLSESADVMFVRRVS